MDYDRDEMISSVDLLDQELDKLYSSKQARELTAKKVLPEVGRIVKVVNSAIADMGWEDSINIPIEGLSANSKALDLVAKRLQDTHKDWDVKILNPTFPNPTLKVAHKKDAGSVKNARPQSENPTYAR